MKILLIVDAEGCQAYLDMNRAARPVMCTELVSVLNRLKNSKDDLYVLDMHGNGHNIDCLIPLYPNVQFMHNFYDLIPSKYDCAVLLGVHAMSNADSPMSHTFRSEVMDVELSGKSAGEFTLISNWLAAYGVPVVFTSGESRLEEEICAYDSTAKYYLYSELHDVEELDHMGEKLLESLTLKTRLPAYNSAPVFVTLRSAVVYDFLQPELFPLEDKRIVFQNTIDFFDKLYILSHIIDTANLYTHIITTCIKRHIERLPKFQKIALLRENSTLFETEKNLLCVSDLEGFLRRIR